MVLAIRLDRGHSDGTERHCIGCGQTFAPAAAFSLYADDERLGAVCPACNPYPLVGQADRVIREWRGDMGAA